MNPLTQDLEIANSYMKEYDGTNLLEILKKVEKDYHGQTIKYINIASNVIQFSKTYDLQRKAESMFVIRYKFDDEESCRFYQNGLNHVDYSVSNPRNATLFDCVDSAKLVSSSLFSGASDIEYVTMKQALEKLT